MEQFDQLEATLDCGITANFLRMCAIIEVGTFELVIGNLAATQASVSH